MSTNDRVTVVVPCLNEEDTIEDLLASIGEQKLRPHEVLVVDGMSTDGTREVLRNTSLDGIDVRVIDNPKKQISYAMNIGLAHATGDVLVRMDCHAWYAPDYIERIMERLRAVPAIGSIGGAMHTDGRTTWGKASAAVLRRRVGLGGAPHRIAGSPRGPVPHVFSAAYRRDALASIGGFDTSLLANEDADVDRRLRERGYLVWLEPSARTTWFARSTGRQLAKQMFRYGYFRAQTIRRSPSSLSPRHIAPPALVAFGLLAPIVSRRTAAVGAGAYAAVSTAIGVTCRLKDGVSAFRSAVAIPVIHMSWGMGALIGFIAPRVVSDRELNDGSNRADL